MITQEQVEKVAKLARLKLDQEKVTSFSKQLSEIIYMIDVLNEIDCEDAKPLTSVCDMTARTRKDEVTSADHSERLFDNVPGNQADMAKEVKYFIVPKVVE